MSKEKVYKIYNISFIFGLFCFLFLWDIKEDLYQPRFLIVLPILPLIFLKDYFLKNFKKNKLIIFTSVVIILHISCLSFFYNYDLNNRDILGLTMLILISVLLTEETKKIDIWLEKSINLFIIIFSILYLFFILKFEINFRIDCYDGWFFNSNFFFLENSHFSIISVPIICYYLLKFCELKKYESNEIFNFIFFLTFLIISFINFSTTFLVGILLSLFFLIIKKYKNLIFVSAATVIIIFSFLILSNYKQCVERSYGSVSKMTNYFKYKSMSELEKERFIINKKTNIKNINMSIETYLVSLEITLRSLKEKPLGIGFNKYYLSHGEYINQLSLIDKDIRKNNIYDGSNNFSKILTEFGLFGVFIILIIPFVFFYKKNISNLEYFLLILVSIQFLRGVGYFNGGFILAYLLILKEFFKIIFTNKLKW